MKKLYFLFSMIMLTSLLSAQSVFINEIHYDNTGGDTGEGIEIAGPAGTDLTGWTVAAYNGSNGTVYATINLSGSIDDEGSGYGALSFAQSGLQNGAPDGLALVDNSMTVIQFLSYEGSLTATDGPANGQTSVDIGVSETSSTPIGESLQLTGSGTDYTNFTWQAPAVSSFGDINAGQTFGAAMPTINITAPSGGTVFDPGTSTVNVEWTTANLAGGESVNITVNGSGDTGVTSPYPVATSDGTTYDVTVELVNAGGTLDTDMVSFSVGSLTTVADLAAVRADYNANGPGAFYSVQSTPTVTYTRTTRNQKYIQDGSAAILIDDAPGVITTTFVEGDGMSGLVGQVSEFNDIMQFNPTQDANVAAGTTITPEVVTLAQIIANQEAYESELVQIDDLTFTAGDGVATFSASSNYEITDPSSRATSNFRTNFSEADYIGTIIPQGPVSIATFVGEFGGNPQVTSRSLADLTLSSDEFSIDSFSVFPNPTSTGFVSIKTQTNETLDVSVFDILGKEVLNQEVDNNVQLNVSGLTSGIYLMRISQDSNSVTKKLIIK